MLKNKKAQMGKKIEGVVLVIILVVILFSMYASLVPEVQTAGATFNASYRCTDVGCFYNTTTASNSGLTEDCANNASGTRETCDNEIGKSGIPLGNLFLRNGIIVMLVMVALVLITLKAVLPKGKK